MPNDIRPKWWQLYLTFPLLIVLFLVESRLKLSSRGHQVMQIGILLLVYALVHLWLKANSSALSQIDRKQNRGRITVIEIPPYRMSDRDKEKHFLVQFPDSEIKGVLDDTYQMEYIDAESFRVDKVSQELEKE
jgi:hypothetical protein